MTLFFFFLIKGIFGWKHTSELQIPTARFYFKNDTLEILTLILN